jgi:hypothetical protein
MPTVPLTHQVIAQRTAARKSGNVVWLRNGNDGALKVRLSFCAGWPVVILKLGATVSAIVLP